MKKKKLTVITAAILASTMLIETPAASAEARPPESYEKAKELLAGIHTDIGHLRTLYCGCQWTRKGRSGGVVDRKACGLVALNADSRSGPVWWEHVVPASRIGEQRACWKSGHPMCGKKDGKPVKGRDCCRKPGVDPRFLIAYSDPHNLLPADSEVNRDRDNYAFGHVTGEPRAYGGCDFEVDAKRMVAEPPNHVRGELARAMLYMKKRYGVDVQMTHADLLDWHRADPPERWEIERALRIEDATGLRNCYVTPMLCASREK